MDRRLRCFDCSQLMRDPPHNPSHSKVTLPYPTHQPHQPTTPRTQGPITRIASGCTEEQLAALEATYAKLDAGRGKFRLHATPDFSMDEKTGKKYYFYNSAFFLYLRLRAESLVGCGSNECFVGGS
jgi:hypothetical protein